MKKLRYFLPCFLLIPLLLAGIYFSHGFDRIVFHKMTEDFFSETLRSDALSLHFTLAHPENFDIALTSASLPVYSEASSRRSEQAAQNFFDRLSRINPNRLKEEERYTYDLLYSYLEQEIEGQNFLYYEEPLSPSSGMQSELPLLFAEYTFRNKGDVETYLSLLESVSPYLQGLSDYEAEKAQAGLFMSVADAQNVITQCDEIIDASSLSCGSHFLQTTFQIRLEKLCQDQEITEQEKEYYLGENDRILTTIVLPAYAKLGDDLTLLAGKGLYDGGLCEKPDGRDYYAWLVARTTGSTQDTEGIYVLLQRNFQKNFSELKDLILRYRELTGNSPDPALLSDNFPLSDPSDILADLQIKMQNDFPALSGLSSETVNCTIKNVDPALESYTSPAFYMTPPIDDLFQNTICINRASTSEGIELYTTLAHEGYPGHLYQSVYSSLYASIAQKQPVRELLYYGGYVEGWAYYTERLSYDYASALIDGADSHSATTLLCRICSLQRDLQINLFSLLDISLHYYGASKEEILSSLCSFGLSEEGAEQIYNYIRTSPAVYLKYFVGYLEMTALKNRAKAQWGEDYSPLKFHQFVLEAGPSDFTNLTRRLKSTGASPSASRRSAASSSRVPRQSSGFVRTVPPLFHVSSSSIDSIYPLSHKRIFSFFAASTAGWVKY
ncbi:MAG: DUF885 domain-containing protein [Eubacteriales bacterium]|nr:DUF885 domain-containing protein [Eubacteriales bacterium]